MVQLSGFGRPKTLKFKRTLTRGKTEQLNNFEKRKLESTPFSIKPSKPFDSTELEKLQKMKYPTLVDHLYSCMEKADTTLAETEALLAFSSIGGFEVEPKAYLAFKAIRSFLNLAKSRKFNFADAIINGIGLAVPSARLAGFNQYSGLNRGARLSQLIVKKTLKGESPHPANALTVYGSVVPSLTTKKIGASAATLLARQYAALSALKSKSGTKKK